MKMRSEIYLVLAAVVFLAAFSFDVSGQGVGASRGLHGDGSYTVTGKVRLPDGSPAVGARVDVSCDFTSRSSTTDDKGEYRVTAIPAGNCTVVARVSGYDALTEHRQITRDTPYGQAIYIPMFIRASSSFVTNPMFDGVPKSAVEKYKSSLDKLQKGDADGALALLDQAITTHPQFGVALFQKGSILLKKNEVDKAIEAFVKAIEIHPDYVEAKYAFGMAQFQKKNYEVSEAVFRDVIKQNKDMAEAHLNLGISLFYLKKADEAETELKSAVTTKGGEKLALAYLYLGQIYVQKKRNSEAASELQKYVDLVPMAPNAERIKSVIADLKKQS